MKKFLIKFWIDGEKPDNSESALWIKCVYNGINERHGVCTPVVTFDSEIYCHIGVDEFEIDYEKSGKLWFNTFSVEFDGGKNELRINHCWGKDLTFTIEEIWRFIMIGCLVFIPCTFFKI